MKSINRPRKMEIGVYSAILVANRKEGRME